MIRLRYILCLLCLPLLLAAEEKEQYEIKVEWYHPNGRHDIPLVCFEVMRQDPTIVCKEFSPLNIQGGMGYQSGKVMAFATGAGPDVFNMWTYEIVSYVDQGFLLPLNEYIGYDGILADGTPKLKADGTPDKNGQIDDDEATWEYWKQLDPLTRKIATFDGKVYTIPARRQDYVGIMYRKDLMEAYNLPHTPANSWDEFYRRMQLLTWPDKHIEGADVEAGLRGLYLHRYHVYLYPWVWAAGGSFVQEGKTNPETGKTHWYAKEELEYIDPDTGQTLRDQTSEWRVTFTTPEVLAAYDFLWKCFHGPWVRHRETEEPINLTPADLKARQVTLPDGSVYEFSEQEVIRGVARTHTMDDNSAKTDLFRRGEIVCFQSSVGTDDATGALDIRPDQLGFWAVPPRTPEDDPVVLLTSHWLGITPSLGGEANKTKRDKAWKVASSLGSDLGKRMYVRYMVQQGRAMFMRPEQLELAGLEAYVEEIPDHWQEDYDRIFKSRRYQPYNKNWLQVARNELAKVFDDMARNPEFDYKEGLEAAEYRANNFIMRPMPPEQMNRYRRIAYVLCVLVLAVVGWFIWLFVKAMREKAASAAKTGNIGSRNVYNRWLPWLLLAPALLSIILWAYYPLLRGTAMAFMDYKLMGEREWIGLDNFIMVVRDPVFRESVVATIRYVVVALGLTFLVPIVLAILLNEIPWFKQSLRTCFFLPQICSGVVIMLLWKQMFEGSAKGYLNQVVLTAAHYLDAPLEVLGNLLQWLGADPSLTAEPGAVATWFWQLGDWFVNPAAVDWLGNTFWAPICVVLPGLWASMGMASLIYLAALKSVGEDIYEAADIDGAGLWHKVWYITIPTLKPLIVINFVGAFIGTFHHMQNVFVMTGGSSGTRVLGLHIWLTAYADLMFGRATATAWILASMLIGFTVWQLQILKKVEFRRAAEN